MAINLRDLALNFFKLRYSQKLAIVKRFDLLDDEELADSGDFCLWQRAIMRARQLGLIEDLALAVDAAKEV